MDPDACLKELRELAELPYKEERIVQDTAEDRLDRMQELFRALDGWLESGGFLPEDWRKWR